MTLRDGFSRFVLCCEALRGPTYEATRRRLSARLATTACPSAFAATTAARLRVRARRLSRLRLVDAPGHPARTDCAGHPEQNGSHEQFHSVLKADTARPPAANARAQQRRFARFCAEYNDDRPHEALAGDAPGEPLSALAAIAPRRLPPLEYPAIGRSGASPHGQVSWGGEVLFLSGALVGEDVAFEEVDDGLWTVHFATLALGRYDVRHRRIQPIAPLTEGRSPAAPARA